VRRVKEYVIQTVVAMWVVSLFLALFTVYAGSWRATLFAMAYIALTLTIGGFIAGKVRLNEDDPKHVHRDDERRNDA
jgi:hypothetical protein